jgi:putative endonuclease
MHPTYKRMLAGLEKKRKAAVKNRRGPAAGGKTADEWSLYILKCRDGTFYTGITNNLERRLKMHQDGKASRYTRTRGPVEMLYSEGCGDRSSALIRECEVKEWPKKKKVSLISGEWKDLPRKKELATPAQRATVNAQRKALRCALRVERCAINSTDLPVCSPARRSA